MIHTSNTRFKDDEKTNHFTGFKDDEQTNHFTEMLIYQCIESF